MRIRRVLPVVLTALLLLSASRQLRQNLQSFRLEQLSNGEASTWDARMRSVAAALPSDVHAVGYLDATNLDPSIPRRVGAEFYLTQYGLAPVVVQIGSEHEWIVADLGNALNPRQIRLRLEAILGSYTVQEFGFGVYLIHRLPG